MKIGTLRQIGAKVGDTVVDTSDGMKFKIERIDDGYVYGVTTWIDGDVFEDAWSLDGLGTWQIVSTTDFEQWWADHGFMMAADTSIKDLCKAAFEAGRK